MYYIIVTACLCVSMFMYAYCCMYSYYNTEDIAVCDVFCYGDEDRLTDCDLTTNPDLCSCSSGTVGITCSK